MSKRTTAIMFPSPRHMHPWGEDGWRPCGIIQLVQDGPDFLWSGAAQAGAAPSSAALTGMVLRDTADERAADLAVMAFGMLDLPGWEDLARWWEGTDERPALLPRLQELGREHGGEFKLGVVRLEPDGSAELSDLLDALAQFGLTVEEFARVDHA